MSIEQQIQEMLRIDRERQERLATVVANCLTEAVGDNEGLETSNIIVDPDDARSVLVEYEGNLYAVAVMSI